MVSLTFSPQSRSASRPATSPSRDPEVRYIPPRWRSRTSRRTSIPAEEERSGCESKLGPNSLTLQFTGKLVKNLGHLAVSFAQPKKNQISIEIHHGNRKNVATLRTVRSIIDNLIVGVTKGFKYKMRYVYAHFPINVNVDKNAETGIFEVEIRNFIGEKIVRRVVMQEGVDVEISKNQKDELVLTGNNVENVSQSAADIQQICRVRNKDIRKVRFPGACQDKR